MSKTNILEWDSTAANNTDMNGVGINGTNNVNNFDNAFRELMAQGASNIVSRFTSRAAGYTAVKADHNQVSLFTATATLSLTAAATLTNGWEHTVVASGGDVTIDPSGAELINGVATVTIYNGQRALIRCNGTAFYAEISGDASVGVAIEGHLYGLLLSNNVADSTNDIDIATGSAASDGTTPYLMTLSSAITKRLDAAWAVGTNQGGLDTGSIANTTYHIWLIQRSDTGVVDALFSTSATSPTMPANYDRKRRIGSILRESAAIVGFFQLGRFFYRGPKIDYDSTSALASQTVSLSVPTGIRVRPIISSQLVIPASSNVAVSFGAGQGTATGFVGQTGFTGTGEVASDTTQISSLITNTNRQIYLEVAITSGSITTCRIRTHGWIDDL
ncbi:hypothetical protein [Rhizobium hidalgonense]|uniref:hypothetical protein n=1 Tax=Rhizobium hidalgonense TaxID=1538159 RepID=UPI0028725309|nr:hypothetical protein [Rhizobium hidalgonense]MDR9813117.1 hypothetical protein [Rhizobium hidalgonense]